MTEPTQAAAPLLDRRDAGDAGPVLDVKNLVVRYGRPGRKNMAAPAVNGVSFTVGRGETVGLVGESGSGKTTIGKAILGLQAATDGTISYDGRDITHASVRERRALGSELRAVFQDPYSSLNPRLTIGATLAEPLRIRGVSREDADLRARAMLEKVGLPADAADRFPRQFSGGQRQRIAVARALICEPSLVVCDEPVSALDLSTQAQVLNLLADLRTENDLSYLFIAHDIAVVSFLAQRVIVLYRGEIMESGPSREVTETPRHPFTRALVAASPVPRPAEQAERRAIREALTIGATGAASVSATGCPFAARCPAATELCRTVRPALLEVGGVEVACHAWDPTSGHPGLADHPNRPDVAATAP
jgi:oligopeptide/dipeptide ABC transporter ATP-binding protein